MYSLRGMPARVPTCVILTAMLSLCGGFARATTLDAWGDADAKTRTYVLALARRAFDTYISERRVIDCPNDLPSLLRSRVAISVDGTRFEEFRRLTGAKLPFPVCMDPGSKVTGAYGVSHVPTVIVLDRDGRIAYTHIGYPGNDVLLRAIRRISARRVE
jgi:hypothetical protein